MALAGYVCIVTGGTRGIGNGIALQLGEAGATVYVTGRTLVPKDGSTGSLQETARDIESRGGKCVPVQCDHSNDDDIKALFERIQKEQNGRLDLLVNNAYAAINFLSENYDKPFYELPVETWDIVNNVGLRNHYICSVYAARMMVKQGHGLIIWISSLGGHSYLFNTAYGVGKAACDRMAADCALELKDKNIACISLWPGAVKTETILESIQNETQKSLGGDKFVQLFQNGESIEFPGKAVVGLLKDKKIMKKSGKILLTSDLAEEYGFKDIDGKMPRSTRSLATQMELGSPTMKMLSAVVPSGVKIPFWAIHLQSSKF